ncbi:MAG: M48 family metalloprotease, partial [Nitriliruptorales bacterium]
MKLPGPATRERVWPYAVVAVGLATAGVAASLWRPLAPPPGDVITELDDFAPAVLDAVRAYRGPRRLAAVINLAVAAGVPVLLVATEDGRRLLRRVAGPREHSPRRAAAVGVVIVAAADLVALPIAYGFGFVHEERWSFRTSGVGGWARDWVISRGLGWTGAALGAALLAVGLRRWPRTWHWRVVPALTGIAAALVLAAPVVVEPLFLRTTPLDPGPTRTAVEDVLSRAGIGDARVLVGDASRRTTKVNAYVSGLGPTRRVVLFDTLLELPPERVASVVAHELAHRRNGDLARGVALTAGAALVVALALRAASRSRLADLLGVRSTSDPRLVGLLLAGGLVLFTVGIPIQNWFSRRVEAAADHGAMELTGDPATLVEVQRIFVVRDLADPEPPAWSTFLFASHPPPAERIRRS